MKTAGAYMIAWSFGWYAGTHDTPYWTIFVGGVIIVVFEWLGGKLWKKLKGAPIKYQ